MNSRSTFAVVLLVLVAVASVHAIDATSDSMNTCTGGGAFGMFRRQPGCAINNCQCFPVLFQCDASLGDGIGQCVLSSAGWAFMITALMINLIVPGVTLLRHAYEDGKIANQQRANKHLIHNVPHAKEASVQDDVAPADGVIPNAELYINLKKFGQSVPDTAYGLDSTAKIFMETMSKGWIQYIFYSLIVAFVFCLGLLWFPFEMVQTEVTLAPQTSAPLNATSYEISSFTNTNLPTAIRFVSIEGDFCAASQHILARNGLDALYISYDLTFSVDNNDILESFTGAKALGCTCANGVCALVPSQSSTIPGLLPLVYFPWYQDISKPFQLVNKNHTFELNATFTVSSASMPPGAQVAPIPRLSLVAHHSYVEKITDGVDFVVWVLDFVFFGLWFYLNRKAKQPKDEHNIPERKVVVMILFTNILSSIPIFYLSNWFSIHATNQTIYLFSHVWTSSTTGLWLLGLLFAIDMQRKRVFTFRFVCVKVTVGLVGLTAYVLSFYLAPVYISSMMDFILAMLAAAVFRGVMVNVRNQLRNQSYTRTRPEQLTARLLYYIGMAVTYIFILVAICADPVPRVSTFISRYALMTDLSMQIMLRTCTWVILLVFLPPTYVNPAKAIYYGREQSALPHLTNGPMRDFELAHLKQAVAAQSRTYQGQSYGGANPAAAFKAPHAFCIETGVRMYNMATAVYETLDLDVFAQDGLTLVTELYDAGTDTYGYVLRGDKRIVVAFRGTASAKNAITDVKYNLVATDFAAHNHPEYEKIRVHLGFWTAYNTVRAELKKVVLQTMTEMGPELQLYFTGHSLGGALATLASFDIAYSTSQDVVMYNFGSPRVGNHAFAKCYNKLVPNAYRIVNDGDAVVGNPKRVLHAYCSRNLRYKHVGTVILLSSRASGVFVLDPNIVEMAFIAKLRNNGLSHLMSSYQVMLLKGVDWIAREETNKLIKATNGIDSEKTPLMQV